MTAVGIAHSPPGCTGGFAYCDESQDCTRIPDPAAVEHMAWHMVYMVRHKARRTDGHTVMAGIPIVGVGALRCGRKSCWRRGCGCGVGEKVWQRGIPRLKICLLKCQLQLLS